MNGHLILTIGIPASGKSSYAWERYTNSPNVEVVERDMIRERLTGTRQNFDHEMQVTRIAQQETAQALAAGKTVIISDTNLRKRFRREWETFAEHYGATYEEVWFDTPFDVCVERNAARPEGYVVPHEVMLKMYQQFSSAWKQRQQDTA